MKNNKNNSILSNFDFQSPRTVQAGYTLIELMVSLSLFIIIVLALIGSLYTVNDASRKVQAMRTVMDNLNFAMESMSRTIRTSENIGCPVSGTDCLIGSTNNTVISMRSTLGERREVFYEFGTWGNGNGRIEKKSTGINPDGTLNYLDFRSNTSLTSPEINVQKLKFYVGGTTLADKIQPYVIIKIEGVATIPGSTTVPFAIQTYLSQRTVE